MCVVYYSMMEDYNHLLKWLPPRIEKLGLTKEQFARRCKISRSALYAYLRDEDRPETQTMARICHVLGEPLEAGLRQYTPKKRGNPNFGPNNPYTRGLKIRK